MGRTMSGPAPVSEPLRAMRPAFCVWVANSTRKNLSPDDLTDALGLTVSLEP